MKRKSPETAAATASPLSVNKARIEGEYLFLLPPGAKLDDVYIDAQEVAPELKNLQAHRYQHAQSRKALLYLIRGKW